MLIRQVYNNPSNSLDEILDRAGIKECKRYFYFFIDREGFESGAIRYGKAIQINVTLLHSRDTNSPLYMYVRSSNSATIKIAMYSYDVYFVNGVRNPNDAVLTLTASYGSDVVTDFDAHKSIYSELTTYSRLLVARPDMRSSSTFDSNTYLIKPEYYSADHMYFIENDWWYLHDSDSVLTYTGRELFDQYTKIEFLDIKSWDTMVPKLIKVVEDMQLNEYNELPITQQPIEFASRVFPTAARSMLNKFSFIYDTQEGSNIIGGTIPFRKYIENAAVVDSMKATLWTIQQVCNEIEGKYGAIRVHYVPTLVGDKVNIIFKDFEKENQPLLSSIDRSFTTESEISQYVYERDQMETGDLFNPEA